MLAQLPPHTVARKVENYEHLDLLWGKDVDKVVIPHVLDFLQAYAEPVGGSKADESRFPEVNYSTRLAHSKPNRLGFREHQTDAIPRNSHVPLAQFAARHSSKSSTNVPLTTALKEYSEESEDCDSDVTIGYHDDGSHVRSSASSTDNAGADFQSLETPTDATVPALTNGTSDKTYLTLEDHAKASRPASQISRADIMPR